jgi:hypothetical protein
MLAWGHAAQGKTVAVVYDDSRSMKKGERWNPANYSMQIIASLLGGQDTLLLVRMSQPTRAVSYQGSDGIRKALADLKRMEELASGQTPYHSLRTAIDRLPAGGQGENWLVIITDADEFTDIKDQPDLQHMQRDIELAVTAKQAHVAFLLIENAGNNQGREVVDFWRDNGQAIVMNATSPGAIPAEMEKLATLMQHAAGDGGLTDERDGNRIAISSTFPLRGLIMLRQDDFPGELIEATHPSSGRLQLRQHIAQARKVIPEIASVAKVYHLSSASVMAAGKDIVRLKFDAPTAGMRYKLLPDVAVNFDVRLKDENGPLKRDAQGYYRYCQDQPVRVEARLLDDSGRSITKGRKDLSSFDVGINLPPGKLALNASEDFFQASISPSGKTGLTAHARFPGYFHLLSRPIQLAPRNCSKDIRVFVKSGLDKNGLWSSPVNDLGNAGFVRLSATVNGRPITTDELSRLRINSDDKFDIQTEGTDWIVRPKDGCCMFFWTRPGTGEFSANLQLQGGRPADRITLPPAINFRITPPDTLPEKIWWFVCPVLVWFGLIALIWYAWKLLAKERFAPKASLWLNEPEHPKTTRIALRKRGNWLLRWFWPSRRETVTIDGFRLSAIGKKGSAILVSGKSLGEQHEIDGWIFDESLKESKRPQPDARVTDGGEIRVRHPRPTRTLRFIRRYRYQARMTNAPDFD